MLGKLSRRYLLGLFGGLLGSWSLRSMGAEPRPTEPPEGRGSPCENFGKCTKCECRGFIKSSFAAECDRLNCGHSNDDHEPL